MQNGGTSTHADHVQLTSGTNREVETKVTRYGDRYWAVYLNEQLLAVTVYKKGALAVQHALESQSQVNVGRAMCRETISRALDAERLQPGQSRS